MSDFIQWLKDHGKLTSEEVGSQGNDNVPDPDNLRRRGKPSKEGQTRGFQQEFWDRYPSLKNATPIKAEKWISAGGVVVRGLTPELIDYVCLVRPNGSGFGKLVFPKGRIDTDKNETKEITAIREVAEEAGVLAKHVPDGYLGAFDGLMSKTHFFLMYRASESKFGHDNEIEEVLWFPIEKAFEALERVKNSRDIAVLKVAQNKIATIRAKWAAERP